MKSNDEVILETKRIILRRWKLEDIQPFSELNADSRVMEFFPSTLSQAETVSMMKTIKERISQNGFGFWAAELKDLEQFIGFVGLNIPGYPLPFAPCVEIGWRLAYPFWGKGLAQEAAMASLCYGFKKLDLKEIVSFTTVKNHRSRRVMEKIGMEYDPKGDFDHPNLLEGHSLRRHVLYRIKKNQFKP